jgi:broad specificity phosphatase PhoE
MLIILARHGETAANAEHRFQGQANFPLNERGRRQAQKLAACLARYRPDRLYTSDLDRSIETAAPLAGLLTRQPVPFPVFREYSFGALEGLNWPEIEDRFPELYPKLRKDLRAVPIPGQEPPEAFRERLQKGLRILLDGNGETAALIGHGRYLNALVVEFLGLDFQGPWPFTFASAAVTILESQAGRRRLLSFNEQCHLTGDNDD